MGESAEFEKLTTLEARLAAALDRIAVGLGEARAAAPGPVEDPGLTSAELEDAQARAGAAETRVAEARSRIAALETELGEMRAALAAAQANPSPGVDVAALTSERDALAARLQSVEAARAEADQALADRDAEIARLTAAVEDAGAASQTEAEDTAPQTAEIELWRSRASRWKTQRNEARIEREELRDQLDEATKVRDQPVDARVLALRAEAARLRQINDALIRRLEEARPSADGSPGWDAINAALLDEVLALRQARAAEAAELERILQDLTPAMAEGG